MVCSGNICRSPSAEVVLRTLAAGSKELEIEVESAGMGAWHIGQGADPRTVATWEARGYRQEHRARQFQTDWFERFDLLFAMDRSHQRELLAKARSDEERAKVRLLREFDAESNGDLDVPDPYFGGQADFEEVLTIIERSLRQFISTLSKSGYGNIHIAG